MTDKRHANGHDFVYFGMGSISSNSEVGRLLCVYTRKVLTALNIVEGAGHAEIVVDKNGPCLVEIGARWVIRFSITGFNQSKFL